MTKRVFITGGASGLGRSLAERYAREGWSVCIGDVNQNRGSETLTALKSSGATAHFLKCDVTSETDFEQARAWLKESWGGVDVVINNAGVGAAGAIDELSIQDWQWIVDINLLGVVRGCKVFAPLLKEQKSGTFINIASVAGIAHAPGGAAYNATKAGVIAISETIRMELMRHGVQVSVVCPYFFRTNLLESFRGPNQKRLRIAEKCIRGSEVDAATIANRIFEGVARNEFLILPDFHSRAVTLVKRFAPYSLYSKILGAQLKKMKALG